jgi:hypothetical protein
MSRFPDKIKTSEVPVSLRSSFFIHYKRILKNHPMVKQTRTRTANKLSEHGTGLTPIWNGISIEKIYNRVVWNNMHVLVKDQRVVAKDIRAVDKDIRLVDKDIRVVANNIRAVEKTIRVVAKTIRAVDKDIRLVDKIIRVVANNIRAVEKTVNRGVELYFIFCIALIISVLRYIQQNKKKQTGGKNVES